MNSSLVRRIGLQPPERSRASGARPEQAPRPPPEPHQGLPRGEAEEGPRQGQRALPLSVPTWNWQVSGMDDPQLLGKIGSPGRTRTCESASMWAALLRRVFALDVCAWPRCGGRRRVVGVHPGGESLQARRLGRRPPRAGSRRSAWSASRWRSGAGRVGRPSTTRAGVSKELRFGVLPRGLALPEALACGRRGRDRAPGGGRGHGVATAKGRLEFLAS